MTAPADATGGKPPTGEHDTGLAHARALHAAGRFDEAEAAYDAILAVNPAEVEALDRRGLLDFERGRLGGAVIFTERAAALAPDDPLFPARLGAIRKTEGRLVDALNFYQQALVKPTAEQESLWHEIGNILFELGDFRQACTAYREVLKRNPNSAGALNNLGNALCELAPLAASIEVANEAVGTLRRVLSIAPRMPGARTALARAYNEKARLLLVGDDVNGALNAVRDGIRHRDSSSRSPKLIVVQRETSAAQGDMPVPTRHLAKVRVLTGDRAWYVLTSDNKLYVDDMSNATPELEEYVRVSAPGGQTILQLDAPRIEVQEPCFLLGGSRNYYHWMLDYLPRLGIPEARSPLRLLVNDDLTQFQRDCLAQIGIDQSRLLRVRMPSIVHCSELVAPPIASPRQQLNRAAANWLRDQFLPSQPPTKQRRLYVSRQDVGLRRVVNEDELMRALARYDFELVLPSALTVLEQASLFSHAAIILGPHGAGLANMVFAPRGATVIELSAARRQRPSFMAKLAAGLGLPFHRVECWSLPSAQQRMSVNQPDQDMVVPAAEITRLISSVLNGSRTD